MGFIGKQPTPAPLTTSDITDGIITSAKIADGTIATADISDSAVTKVKTSGVTSDMFRNKIINGDISVSQRGTSFTNVASGDYTIDRWKMNYRSIGNADISQVDNKTYKSLKVLNSNASTQEIIMGTRIEDITQFNNESFVLSFFAKASASCTLDTRVFENYGSGGSSTVTRVASGSQNKTITTSRQRFSITFTPSDMSSLTIGTSNFLEINFSVSLAASAYWEYDSVQLEKGTTATDFEFIPFELNLQRCYRYCVDLIKGNQEDGAANEPICNGRINNADQFVGVLVLPTEMRANPSLIVNDISGSFYVGAGGNGGTISTLSSGESLRRTIEVAKSSMGLSLSAGDGAVLLTANSNSILRAEAEL